MASRLWFLACLVAACCSVTESIQFETCSFSSGQNPRCDNPVCTSNRVVDTTPGITCASGQCCIDDTSCNGVNCNGNGNCVMGVCQCNDGYSGSNCETDECAQCSQNSTCNRFPPSLLFNCTCDPGFSGPLCDVDECANNGNCSANGVCIRGLEPEVSSCNCSDGYSGPTCDIDACNPDYCQNGGQCIRLPFGASVCDCPEPYFGDNCTQTICDSMPCQNDGACVSVTTLEYNCNCPLNYTGQNCTDTVCVGNNSECNFQGTCIALEFGNFTCQCDPGWSGADCSINEPICGIEVGLSSRSLNADQDVLNANSWLGFVNTPDAICHGALVSKTHLLTDTVCAAYCQQNLENCTVRVGEYTLSAPTASSQTFSVVNVTINSQALIQDVSGVQDGVLDPDLAYNIAILELDGSITKGAGVNTLCPPQGFDATICSSNCKVATFGFSLTETTFAFADVREVLRYRPIDNDFCRFYRNFTTNPTATRCGFLEKDGAGLCISDNGSPVVCQNPSTGQWSLEGIVAFRPTNGEYGVPSTRSAVCSDQVFVYTDVEALMSWITARVTFA